VLPPGACQPSVEVGLDPNLLGWTAANLYVAMHDEGGQSLPPVVPPRDNSLRGAVNWGFQGGVQPRFGVATWPSPGASRCLHNCLVSSHGSPGCAGCGVRQSSP